MSGPAKRKKLEQTDLRFFFSKCAKGQKRLICKGSKHQGELVNGGSQCVCISLAFVSMDGYPRTQKEVDRLLWEGTELFNMVSADGNCLLISEIPTFVELGGQIIHVECQDSRSGLMSQHSDDPESMTYCITSALRQCFDESSIVFLTLGDSTIGIKRIGTETTKYVLMDSHSRDDNGMCSPVGTSVVIEMSTQNDLSDHIKNLAASFSAQDMQFELTAVFTRKGSPPDDSPTSTPHHGDDIPAASQPSCSSATPTSQPGDDPAPTSQPGDGPAPTSQPGDGPAPTSQPGDGPAPTSQPGDGPAPTSQPGDGPAPTSQPGDGPAPTSQPGDGPAPTSQPGDGPAPTSQPGDGPAPTSQPGDGPAPTSQPGDPGDGPTPTPQPGDGCTINQQPGATLSSDPEQIDCDGQHHEQSLDVKHYNPATFSDAMKFKLVIEREPGHTFSFPPKCFKDKRSKTGQLKRYCQRSWFKTFSFIAYSKEDDGLYCLACVLFPDTSHRRSKKFITEPYSNWKDAIGDLKTHSACVYHLNSMEKYKSFKDTYNTPSQRIDVTMATEGSQSVARNRKILESIVKSLVFCGRQGIALRSHRDDNTASSLNTGNFKELLQFRIDAGDKLLQDHLSSCARNTVYTSKTAQNDLLHCIKTLIQQKIVDEVKSQAIGPYFGFQCDEVTDSSNWEQLGIVLRYTTPESRPVERLLEFVACEEITGAAIAEKILQSFTDVGLNPSMCRSQTMDGAGNMAGKCKGCAALIQQQFPRAVYHYCSSHDLNLALSKSCQVKEVHIMLDTLKQLGLFFKYSPKRSRRLESAIEEVNKEHADKIKKSKFKLFCETRWVEKHTCLDDFDEMYEALLMCLEAISSLEAGWDTKAVVDANGLLKKISDQTFIVCFQTVHQYFAYFSGLSRKLQGSTLDILQAYGMVEDVKSVVEELRNDKGEYDKVFAKATQMAGTANISSIETPRRCGRQTQRSNVPADSPKEYFHRAVYLPFVDGLLAQVNMRFSSLSKQAVQAMILIPKHHSLMSEEACDAIFEYFREDLPSPAGFHQECRLWKRLWSNKEVRPDSLQATVADESVCQLMYPNIFNILHILMLTSVTSSSVERANSSLKYIKNKMRSTMGQDRFNALALLYIHKDIPIDIDAVVTLYARRNPRRMLLINPLSD